MNAIIIEGESLESRTYLIITELFKFINIIPGVLDSIIEITGVSSIGNDFISDLIMATTKNLLKNQEFTNNVTGLILSGDIKKAKKYLFSKKFIMTTLLKVITDSAIEMANSRFGLKGVDKGGAKEILSLTLLPTYLRSTGEMDAASIEAFKRKLKETAIKGGDYIFESSYDAAAALNPALGALIEGAGTIGDWLIDWKFSEQRYFSHARLLNNMTEQFCSEADKPDLVINSVQAPESATIGDTVSLVARVKNDGSKESGTFTVGFYLSNRRNISSSDYQIGSCRNGGGVSPGGVNTCRLDIKIPPNLDPGAYFIGAIVDEDGFIDESNETNNIKLADNKILIKGSQEGLPDIVVKNIAVEGGAASATGELRITAKVENIGGADAPPLYIGYYFSTNSTISRHDTRFNWCRLSKGIAVGEVRGCVGLTQLDYLTTMPPGEYYFGVVADDKDEVSESDEDNNTSRGIRVRLN